MLLPQHGKIASAILHRHVSGVSRVLIARTDGIAFYDDMALGSRDSAAAAISALLGLDRGIVHLLGMGALGSTVVRGGDATLFVQPLDSLHVIAVVVEGQASLATLDAALGELRRYLDTGHEHEVRERIRREEGFREAQVPVEAAVAAGDATRVSVARTPALSPAASHATASASIAQTEPRGHPSPPRSSWREPWGTEKMQRPRGV